MIELTLPLPPSINAMYGNNPKKGRGRYKTSAYRKWIREADQHYLAQKQYVKPMTGQCELIVFLPAGMRGDASNRLKACEDYLVSRGITGDDKHNWSVKAERSATVEPGTCRVAILPREAPAIGYSGVAQPKG